MTRAITDTRRAGAPLTSDTPKRRRSLSRHHRGWLLLFLAPWAIGLTVFFLYPLAATLWYSFTDFDGLATPGFVGLRNYVYLFAKDPVVATAAYNTVWLVAVLTVCRVAFALAVASVLARLKRGVGLVRTLCYLPSLVPPVAATITFVFIMAPEGPVSTVLGWLGIEGPLWFSDPALAKPALVLLTLWGSGEIMIIILAALLDVPKELHEAAQLDGAGPWSRFRNITLPSIAPVLLFAVVNTIVFALQYFTQAVVAGSVASGSTFPVGSTRVIGYPADSTLTFTARMFDEGFRAYHMGYASAMAVLLFLVSFAFTAVLIRQLRARSPEAVRS
ncbi:carbohydrate ABC transporter membrane protein 1 (CUT1 family) [Tamaricihabitans halophyticus]|uniref:Carbohydrate ABC transporter membrane protein 1 (CUT1 family) n=1 Tax=Tamaricihabitans halophyticus TaxID=1262583 RepID=A0A4R2R058_9PSEU|nr:sugar ABC transporter permease [Tamaricihabitans halophyticus]TCP55054.1 carbohydrate ABC transporter membrane protein 1 (CUT1 family) [Tamaricihabitans halophyticus]